MFCFAIFCENKGVLNGLLDVRFSSRQDYDANAALEGYAKSIGGTVVKFNSMPCGGDGKIERCGALICVEIQQAYLSTDS